MFEAKKHLYFDFQNEDELDEEFLDPEDDMDLEGDKMSEEDFD